MRLALWGAVLFSALGDVEGRCFSGKETIRMDRQALIGHLDDHLKMLTRTIGERSVRRPDNMERSAAYIQSQFELFGLKAHAALADRARQHL